MGNETKTLGQQIGKVVDNFTIKNDANEKVQLKLYFDFSLATDNEIKSWLCGNRRIAFQRPARALTADELNELDGNTIIAQNAGVKPKSKTKMIAEYVAMGLPEHVAEIAVNEPEKFKTIMDGLNQ